MRLHTLAPLAFAAAIAACTGSPPPATPAPDDGEAGRLLQVGTPVEARLAAEDPTWGMSGRFHLYRFDARAGERFGLDLMSEDFDTYLVVGDRSGGIFNPLDQNDDGGEGLDSRLRFVAPHDGTYWVLAQALSDDGLGAYTIELSRLPAPRPAVPTAIAVGGSAFGELTDDDALQEDESFYDLYTFQGVAGQRYAIALSSPGFDTYLHVGTGTGADFDELERNDDADGTDSRIVFTPDRSGTYSIQASSYGPGETGDYSISIRELAPPGPLTIVPIEIGESVSGMLDLDDQVAEDGSYFDVYRFHGTAGQRIGVSQHSEDFDSYLQLGSMSDGDFEAEYSDDDSGGGLDSRIIATLSRSGEFLVRANSLSPGETGAYTLVVEELPPPGPPSVRSIDIGQTLNGRLEPSDALLDDGSHYDVYTFHGTAGQRVRVTLRSGDFDAFLAFGRWQDGEIRLTDTDDDSGGGLDSELVVTLPATGAYAFRANSLNAGELGGYTVSVEEE